MASLRLANGACILIDDADYLTASKHNWYIASRGYVCAKMAGEHVYLHRWLINEPNCEVDHINRNKLDCRRANLRCATRAENARNRKLQANNTSGFRGVSWHKVWCHWAVRLEHNGKKVFVGAFRDKEDAARAYDAKARELFGEFASLNFPGEK